MKKTETLMRSFQGDMNPLVILAGVLSVLGMVFLVIKIGSDPTANSRLPEEAILANFAMLPSAGPWLGIDITPTDRMLRTMPNGVLISRVMLSSPAAKAGLQSMDVVVRVENTPITMPGDIRRVIADHKAGDRVRVTIERQGRQRAFNIRLDSQPIGKLAAAVTPVGTPWLGVNVQQIDGLIAKNLGLPDTRGVIVADVHPGSPAALAGLAQGDVIRRIGQTRLRNIDQLSKLVALEMPGEVLNLTVLRRGTPSEVRVTLATKPRSAKQSQPTLPEAEVEIEAAWLGLDIVPLSPMEAEEFGVPDKVRGMIVDAVAPGRGIDAGFQPGDVVVAVNGMPTPTVGDFKDATEGAPGALVDVIRFGHHIYISVPPPGGMMGPSSQKPSVRQAKFRAW
jgi:serine protease Do